MEIFHHQWLEICLDEAFLRASQTVFTKRIIDITHADARNAYGVPMHRQHQNSWLSHVF